ncbi:MAG: IMP cyclohydrolase [Oscillospiraceae bacterium]
MVDLKTYLEENSYPGRGILIGKTATHTVIAYFIMGRSENSRNRIFLLNQEGIRTQAFDSSKLSDPSLIIYAPVRVLDGATIVTNGDQTDTIYNFLKEGKTFEEALRTREFEPDAPNFTPRISGIVYPDASFKLSILKSDGGDDASCVRNFFEYDQPIEGVGKIIHTYEENGSPIPSFEGEPRTCKIGGDIDTFTNMMWDSLNFDNKVSLFVRYISHAEGTSDTRIVNKNIRED